MLCRSQIKVSKSPGSWWYVNCGQCASCRARRRDEWALKMTLEALGNRNAHFLTLTYSDEAIERGSEKLNYYDVQCFLKRLRKRDGPIRYFCCGEYGKKRGRKHWHLMIYGDRKYTEGVYHTKLWPDGLVEVAPFLPQRARYCAKYTMKDRQKEGSIVGFSKVPYLGANYVPKIAEACFNNGFVMCPYQLRVGEKYMPIPERIRSDVNRLLDWDESNTRDILAFARHAKALKIGRDGDPLLGARLSHEERLKFDGEKEERLQKL